ncbi:Mur ligase family protein [Rhodobacter capsulatus]|uniref:UDP-N-acetylmuramate--L-alanine ligase n=1 Tax=Rhodobacter capsulatus TaxID=1061 RepID=UPI0023E19155|nr:Mur ligase family protein [Rhodobacter capsulatus]WER08118.1 Mur ligase family protein [Rhodobacter capsulatus]
MSDPAPSHLTRPQLARPHLARMHLIGVGGSGMLPLALLLRQAGQPVTGSDDLCAPARLALLQAQGIAVRSGADPALARAADCVVASPAIPETHVERRAARRAGLPVKTRAEALAEVIAGRQTICVAGSHGKSTVTAMLIRILTAAGRDDFGYMLGASFADPGIAPARLGTAGAPFVTEACEAHGALAQWQPAQAIVTNLDDEHADHYGGLTGLRQAFAAFLTRLPPEGQAVACGDDPQVVEILRRAGRAALTYGFQDGNGLRAVPDAAGGASVFLQGAELGRLALAVPGRHNLLNALAALGMALRLGIGFRVAAEALAGFPGIARRLQRLDTGGGPRLYDDFAHHPAEIAAALAVLRETTAGRLIAVLEPQLHSRVTRMAGRFAQALGAADQSYILPVAALGESARAGDGDAALAAACRAAGLVWQPVAELGALLARLGQDLRGDDTLVVMAGTSGAALARQIAAALSQPSAPPRGPASIPAPHPSRPRIHPGPRPQPAAWRATAPAARSARPCRRAGEAAARRTRRRDGAAPAELRRSAPAQRRACRPVWPPRASGRATASASALAARWTG